MYFAKMEVFGVPMTETLSIPTPFLWFWRPEFTQNQEFQLILLILPKFSEFQQFPLNLVEFMYFYVLV